MKNGLPRKPCGPWLAIIAISIGAGVPVLVRAQLDEQRPPAAAVPRHVAIQEEHPLAMPGWFQRPRFSPAGDELLLTGRNDQGLWVATLDGKSVTQLSADDFAGVEARFAENGREVLYCTLIHRTKAYIKVDRWGARQRVGAETLALAPKPGGHIIVNDEHRVIWRAKGQTLDLSPGAGQYYGPVLSGAGNLLLFAGVKSGIFIFDLETGDARRAGSGSHPAFVSAQMMIVYEKMEPLGGEVADADLWSFDLQTGYEHRMTATPAQNEMFPALSPAGDLLAYSADGKIHLGQIRIAEKNK